jgi:hypothetical protein
MGTLLREAIDSNYPDAAFRHRYLAIQDVGEKAKYQTGTNAKVVLPSGEIVGQAAGEKFRFNSSDRKPVADANFNSATC